MTGFDENRKNNFSQTELQKKFNETQLCFDDQRRYVHCTDNARKTASGTIFASYVHLIPMNYEES